MGNTLVSASTTLSTLAARIFTLFPNPAPWWHRKSYRHPRSGPCLRLDASQTFYFLTALNASAVPYLRPAMPVLHLTHTSGPPSLHVLPLPCPCPDLTPFLGQFQTSWETILSSLTGTLDSRAPFPYLPFETLILKLGGPTIEFARDREVPWEAGFSVVKLEDPQANLGTLPKLYLLQHCWGKSHQSRLWVSVEVRHFPHCPPIRLPSRERTGYRTELLISFFLHLPTSVQPNSFFLFKLRVSFSPPVQE